MDIGGKRVNRPEMKLPRASVKKEGHSSERLHRRLTRYSGVSLS